MMKLALPKLYGRAVGEDLCAAGHDLRGGVSGTDDGIGTKGLRFYEHPAGGFFARKGMFQLMTVVSMTAVSLPRAGKPRHWEYEWRAPGLKWKSGPEK